jgi:hypothetical protein
MKKITFIVTFLVGLHAGASAQSAVDASGGDATGSGGSASYSVGQVVYTQVTGTGGSSNQGVQQPYEFFTGIDENSNINLSMTVFPNPTSSVVNLSVINQSFDKLIYQLFDAAGKLIHQERIQDEITEVPMQSLAPGNYFIHVLNGGSAVKTFKVLKNDI